MVIIPIPRKVSAYFRPFCICPNLFAQIGALCIPAQMILTFTVLNRTNDCLKKSHVILKYHWHGCLPRAKVRSRTSCSLLIVPHLNPACSPCTPFPHPPPKCVQGFDSASLFQERRAIWAGWAQASESFPIWSVPVPGRGLESPLQYYIL